MEIGELFARYGEDYFRRIEHETLCRYVAQPDLILSPGGGAVLQRGNPRSALGQESCPNGNGITAASQLYLYFLQYVHRHAPACSFLI